MSNTAFRKGTEDKVVIDNNTIPSGTYDGNSYNNTEVKQTSTNMSALASMRSRYTTGVSKATTDIIEFFKEINTNYNVEHSAVPVSISPYFKGLVLKVKYDEVVYSQVVIIDERTVRSVGDLVNDAAKGNKIFFASAILSNENSKYIQSLLEATKGTVSLEPVVVVADDIKKPEALEEFVIRMLLRMESKPFSKSQAALDEDRSKPIASNITFSGQNIHLELYHKENGKSMDDYVLSVGEGLLNVTARVDGIVGKKEEGFNQGQQNVTEAFRPIVYLKDFDKPGSVGRHNLEYALASIVAGTVLTRKDIYVTAFLPNPDSGVSIGSLNLIYNKFKNQKGNVDDMRLLDKTTTLDDKVMFINKILANPSLGIDIEYRSAINAYSVFGSAIDDAGKTKIIGESSIERIRTAYKNLTGQDYTGGIIEKTIIYPSGTYTTDKGIQRDLTEIDSIWLASHGLVEEATRWLASDYSASSVEEKINILNSVAANPKFSIDIRVKGLGLKMILDEGFVNNLIKHSRISVEARTILEFPNETTSFSSIANSIGVNSGIGSVGNNTFNGNNGSFGYWG